MKKAYVKPVMESEAFVANEYVAACWRVQCIVDGEEFIITTEPTGEADGDGFTYSDGEWQYWGNRFKHKAENWFLMPFHDVTVVKKSNGNGPHAS